MIAASITVIRHFRLAPLGFLCTKEENIPGNAGAKDVVQALTWVRDNIVAFRGNPANVVVGGQSFGAAIVEALTLSPMTESLYQGVILQSGTVLSPWAFNYDAEDRALELAKSLGGEDVVSTLLNVETGDIVAKSNALDVPYFPFAMCIEKDFIDEECLLCKPPIELLTNQIVNSVPMIIGYNSDEAYIFSSNIKEAKVIKKMSNDPAFLLPEELKFHNDKEMDLVARQIMEMYLNTSISMSTVLAYHRYATRNKFLSETDPNLQIDEALT